MLDQCRMRLETSRFSIAAGFERTIYSFIRLSVALIRNINAKMSVRIPASNTGLGLRAKLSAYRERIYYETPRPINFRPLFFGRPSGARDKHRLNGKTQLDAPQTTINSFGAYVENCRTRGECVCAPAKHDGICGKYTCSVRTIRLKCGMCVLCILLNICFGSVVFGSVVCGRA